MKKIKNNANRKGRWIRQSHLFGPDTYVCSLCKSVFSAKSDRCPACGASLPRVSTDPVWIDEMEEYD